MRLRKKTGIVIFIGVLLVLTTSACKKTPPPAANAPTSSASPEESSQSRLDWNLKTLVIPYKKSGGTSRKWDVFATDALTEFARSRAQVSAPGEWWQEIIATNAAAAIDAGCTDPMIRYLYVRYDLSQTNNAIVTADAFCKVASDIQNSIYPPIRKFYAALRAVNQLFYAYGYSTNFLAEHPVLGQMEPLIGQNIMPALEDKTMPAEEAYDVCHEALASIQGEGIADDRAYAMAYNAIEPLLFKNWPNASTSLLLKGEAYIQLAWSARGPGFANTVSPAQWQQFSEQLAVAENALTNAWQINPKDPRIANAMLKLETGQSGDRAHMELWFQRAMSLDPGNYDACAAKLNYLQPKWYGSVADMIHFGRECATNSNWGGNIPLILLDAHYFICSIWTNKVDQDNYWKQPEVWPDLKLAFDRYFELNPGIGGKHYQYVAYAYKCGQWNEFLQAIPTLGGIDYDYFGGKDEFDKIVQNAQDQAKSP